MPTVLIVDEVIRIKPSSPDTSNSSLSSVLNSCVHSRTYREIGSKMVKTIRGNQGMLAAMMKGQKQCFMIKISVKSDRGEVYWHEILTM